MLARTMSSAIQDGTQEQVRRWAPLCASAMAPIRPHMVTITNVYNVVAFSEVQVHLVGDSFFLEYYDNNDASSGWKMGAGYHTD
jgi:hypothetical protein